MTLAALLSPIGANFIKDFPGQNTVNCDAQDDFAGPCLTSQPLQAYIPSLTAVTTAPTLGTGSLIRGYYYEVFDQIYTWGEFRFGTAGIAAGSGAFLVSLPFPAKSNLGASANFGQAPTVGTAHIHDDSATVTKQAAHVFLRTTTQLMFAVKMTSGAASSEVGSGGPITWAINDGMFWAARYQRQS